MVQVLIVGDVHLADNPPSIRLATYSEEILGKLRFAVGEANRLGVSALVLAGDLLHIKAPSRTSHRLVQQIIDTLQEAKCPVYIVPGNHDLQHDRLESIPRQPIGTIVKADGIDLLIGPHPTLPLYGIPYLQDFEHQLPGKLRHFKEWADEHKAEQWDFMPLLVTHAPIFPPGEDPPFEYIDASDWAEMMWAGHCYYGHIHDPHGIYTIGAVTFCNHGALSRGSLHEKTLARKPAITLWDSYTGFSRIEVPHKPAEEVFRLAEKELTDARSTRVAEFLDGVEETVFEVLSVEQVLAHAETMGLRPRVLKELHNVIEEVT